MNIADLMSDLTATMSSLKPLGWLAVIAGVSLFVCWAFRWKPALLVTLSAAVYAIPILIAGK
jgi:hypothetical protein